MGVATIGRAEIFFSQRSILNFPLNYFRRCAILRRFNSGEAARKGIIYVHWPYCSQLCTYCNFNKYVSRDSKHNDMISCLVQEVTTLLKMSIIDEVTSVYFGGGTPSLAEPSAIETLLTTIRDQMTVSSDLEVSLEVNPTSGQLHKLSQFRLAGVNRLSIGIQSLRDKDLKLFNRDHSVQDALRALAGASTLFKGRINIDMIFGRPGQSFDDWKQELAEVIEICDQHLSLYQLTIEQGTPLAKMINRGEISLPSSEEVTDMYEHSIEEVKRAGMMRYEISNFSKMGAECQHSLSYWTGRDYIGIGPGAHSRFIAQHHPGYCHSINTLEPKQWMNKVNFYGHGVHSFRFLSKKERAEEILATSLRTTKGICAEKWSQFIPEVEPFGTLFSQENEIVRNLCQNGLLVIDERGIRATDKGLNVIDAVTVELLNLCD